jgi:prolyl-tRNA synthetase
MTKGFVSAHWDGTAATEEKLRILQKLRLDVSLDSVEEAGSCILTGNSSGRRVLFAKAY